MPFPVFLLSLCHTVVGHSRDTNIIACTDCNRYYCHLVLSFKKMFYRFHDLKSSITSSATSSSSESSKPQNGKFDDEKKTPTATTQKSNNNTPYKQEATPDHFANLCEQWGTELDEVTQTCLEYSLPITLPALSWLLGYSSNGIRFCVITFLLHTLESALTDFGPRTDRFRFLSAPLTPIIHMFLDCVIVLTHSLFYVLFPHHFGKHPYATSFCFICTLPYYVASSYKTHLNKIRREKEAILSKHGRKYRRACDVRATNAKTSPSTKRSGGEANSSDDFCSSRSIPFAHLLQRKRHPSIPSMHLDKEQGPKTCSRQMKK